VHFFAVVLIYGEKVEYIICADRRRLVSDIRILIRVRPSSSPSSVFTCHPHILRPYDASLAYRLRRRISTVMFTSRGRGPRAGRFVRYWVSRGAKFPKMGDPMPSMPMNRSAKFDPSSFILGGEIRNRTNKQTNKITNSKRYIHALPIGMCG